MAKIPFKIPVSVSGAYAGGGTGILPPNGYMIVHNNIIASGEATLSAENGGKPADGRGSASNPAGEFTALPITP